MKGAHPSLKWAAGLVVLAAVGCGGGGSSPGPPPPPPPPAQLTVTTSSLAAGLTGQSYHVELQASGGTAPYTWNLLSGSFPAGVGMSSTGTIFGTPEAKGTFNVTVQVQDAASRSATRALTLTVTSGLTLNTSALPQGRWYKPYDFFLQAFAGVPPYQWSLASGSGPLPAGFNLFSNGEVNGTTTVPGTYNLLIQVQDTLGDVVSRSFTLEIADSLVVTSGVLPFTIAGQPYSTTLEAKGGAPPYSWDLAADSFPLPNGLSLSTAGVISGTTTLMGSTSLHVNVRDATGATDSGFLLLRMALPLGISTASLPDGNVGVAYLQQLFGSGGYFQGGFNWRLASGSGPLPPGVELRFDGLVSGSPTAAGTFPITVELRDITGQDVTKDLSILIKNDVVVTTTALAYGIVNQPYADSLKAVGGTPPYTWSVGGLPTGLLLNADSGALSGAPTQADTFSLSVQANDSSNPPKSGTATLPMLVRPPLRIVTSTLPDGAATRFYSAVVAVEGGHFPPYKARVASGQLPPGITLFPDSDFAGNFSMGGSPTATGVTDFTIEVSDSGTPPLTAAASFHIRVNPNLSVSDATLPDSVEGQSFSVTFTAAGGAPPYTWTAPTTPTGVTMNPSTGELSGAPTQAYTGIVVVRVQDSATPPQVTDRAFFWHVIGKLRITTSILPPIATGRFFRGFPFLTGGTSTYRWSLSAGALPPGMSLADPVSGEISGTPTTEGTFPFTLRVADSGTGSLAQMAERPLTLIVRAPSALGRNDTIANATPLSSGFFRASISPLADPPNVSSANPDVDVFKLTADPGATVQVEGLTGGITPPSALDPVLEIVDENGVRLNLCSNSIFNQNGPFNQPCMNDDFVPGSPEAKLLLRVPSNAAAPLAFYVRVLDFRGDARPDFLYDLRVLGAN